MLYSVIVLTVSELARISLLHWGCEWRGTRGTPGPGLQRTWRCRWWWRGRSAGSAARTGPPPPAGQSSQAPASCRSQCWGWGGRSPRPCLLQHHETWDHLDQCWAEWTGPRWFFLLCSESSCTRPAARLPDTSQSLVNHWRARGDLSTCSGSDPCSSGGWPGGQRVRGGTHHQHLQLSAVLADWNSPRSDRTELFCDTWWNQPEELTIRIHFIKNKDYTCVLPSPGNLSSSSERVSQKFLKYPVSRACLETSRRNR